MRIERVAMALVSVSALVLSCGAASVRADDYNYSALSTLKSSVSGKHREPPKPADPKADSDVKLGDESVWTVMVFIDGKEDQKGEVDEAIESMEKAGSTKDVKIVAEITKKNWNDDGKIWEGSKRLFIVNEADGAKTATLQSKKQQNKDDWRNVTKFAVYVKKNFPAKHYLLVISDHGNGLKPMQKTASGQSDGNAYDADSAGASMNGGGEAAAVELGKALQKISKVLGSKKIDILALDAGNMADSSVETQLRDHTKYIVAAQGKAFNLRYENFLGDLRQNPHTQPDMLAKSMVKSYQDYYELNSKEPTTLSAVKSEKLKELGQLLRTFTEKARGPRVVAAVKKFNTFPFDFKDETGQNNSDFKDLGDFAKHGSTAKKINAEARDIFKQIRQRMKSRDLIIANGPTGEYKDTASGLSIYLPEKDYKNEFDSTLLSQETIWNEFAKKLTEPDEKQQNGQDGKPDSSKDSSQTGPAYE